MRKEILGATVLALGLAAPHGATASTVDGRFFADLSPLNGSGVMGRADLYYDADAETLRVEINATGLVAGELHPQHIHGRFGPDGAPRDSVVPPPEADDNGNGFVEVAEGAEFYGPILLPLTSPPGAGLSGFPTAPDGTLSFSQIYDLSDTSIFAEGFDKDDIFPLPFREIVLHGGFVSPGVQGTDPDAEGPVYSALIPAAAGEISVVPLPAAGWMLLAGLGALAGAARRRTR